MELFWAATIFFGALLVWASALTMLAFVFVEFLCWLMD